MIAVLIQAEKLLKKLYAAKNLRDATVARRLAALEKAIETVKKGGWEKDLQREIHEANTLLDKVREDINLLSSGMHICCEARQLNLSWIALQQTLRIGVPHPFKLSWVKFISFETIHKNSKLACTP